MPATAPMAPNRPHHRRGTILILVAGISALLASISLVFLVQMRSDAEESLLVVANAQAKIMLAAACNYVQETSRLGWDANYPYYGATPPGINNVQIVPNGTGVLSASGTVASSPTTPSLPAHQETFGWIDVRDGSIGPNFRGRSPQTPPYPRAWSDRPVVKDAPGHTRPEWPAIGSVAICPMFVMQRPPYATQLTAAYNPISTTAGDANFGLPLLRYPDPMPVVTNGWPQQSASGTVAASLYDDGMHGATGNDFVHGNPMPREQTTGKAWFRVYRDGPGDFRTDVRLRWNHGLSEITQEAVFAQWHLGGTKVAQMFNNDPNRTSIRCLSVETRLWYRIEWSSAVAELTYHNLQHGVLPNQEHYMMWPPNASYTWWVGNRTQTVGQESRWHHPLDRTPADGAARLLI
jgi:hypothetical protein